ncbi:UDP-N-acetyl-alpha-D-glucosamine C6 dehydratase [bioreactor metagenome]|uniref:UDP-N-acetyl-alpha-D-glucosamine C6 dehydratase n=1 Tax=bioreactor metagenome TaxID=1076179 RepID=A0A644ZI59_9ZZZZ|nr:nucleoside-diphosphate sugar epimerase/dehydratase [Candidatus Metalachnospira sp.]
MNKIKKYRKRLLMLADLILFAVSFIVLLLTDITGLKSNIQGAVINSVILYIFVTVFQFAFHINESLWRYAEAREYLCFCLASILGCISTLIINMAINEMPLSSLFIITLSICSLVEWLTLRLAYRAFRSTFDIDKSRNSLFGIKNAVNGEYNLVHNIVIIGAGYSGVTLLSEITRNHSDIYKVWAFIDDDVSKIGTKLRGVPIMGPINKLPEILKKSPVYDVILAIPSLELEKRRNIVNMCGKLQCKLRILPDTMMVMENSTSNFFAETRKVKIEDLLGRSTIRFERGSLDGLLSNKTVLVTGGGGSIGSEICRQIASLELKRLVIFDISENDAYLLMRSLKQIYGNKVDIVVEIGSIADETRVNELFNEYRPNVVFHAAAHKHVPLMEMNPCEAVRNNILGTYNLIRKAEEYKCEKFVQISTDKAVNPTNIMGATKRYCEMMIKSMADVEKCPTDFAAVRFGNVLGSNGSVIPIFMSQIEHGGPVTITDKRIIRYFMTIPEAAALVLKAGAMAKNAEIYVLDMGDPIKIIDLAENLIRLEGYTPYDEIDIVETGLRPGEKLYEELLIKDGVHSSTSQDKIFIEQNSETINRKSVEDGIALMKKYVNNSDNEKVRALLHLLIPTYKTPEEVNNRVEQKAAEDKEAGFDRCTA